VVSAPASVREPNCSIKPYPKLFVETGLRTATSSIAFVLQVACEPVFAEQKVQINAQQLSNACQGTVWLRVRAERSRWLFEVADDGPGLSPGEEEFIFEPFRIGSSATGRTGLGLSIVRGIVQAHRGEWGVVNRPGRGATFWIRIPR
jgi:nitrogen-specific signal transduction histidine kinase